jgi:hypothetical protein
VAEDARLEIEFNETVRRGSGTIILTQGNSQQSFPVTGTALTITGKRAFIKPPASFPAGATVSVQIPAEAFRDVQGNNFAGPDRPDRLALYLWQVRRPLPTWRPRRSRPSLRPTMPPV